MTFPQPVTELRLKLQQNGYAPVATYNSEKRPFGQEWQNQARAGDLPPENPLATGTGILGDGLQVVDIDVDDKEKVAAIVTVASSLLGTAPIRWRANSSRCILVYRALKGSPKKRALKGPVGDIEILGQDSSSWHTDSIQVVPSISGMAEILFQSAAATSRPFLKKQSMLFWKKRLSSLGHNR